MNIKQIIYAHIAYFNCVSDACHLADGGQFGEEHLEDWRRKRLLQDLQELLRLTAHSDRIRQMIHAFLVVTWQTQTERERERERERGPGLTARVIIRGVTVRFSSIRHSGVTVRYICDTGGGVITSQCWKYFCFKPWRRANGYQLCARVIAGNVLKG